MPPEVLRNPIDEIYGYTCKKKTQTNIKQACACIRDNGETTKAETRKRWGKLWRRGNKKHPKQGPEACGPVEVICFLYNTQ